MREDNFEFPGTRVLSIQVDSRRAVDAGTSASPGLGYREAHRLGSVIADSEGLLLVPVGAILDLLGDQPLEVDELRDHLGSALRIYARRHEGRAEVALLQRGGDDRWRHLGWNRVHSDIEVHWFARTVMIGNAVRHELDSARICLL